MSAVDMPTSKRIYPFLLLLAMPLLMSGAAPPRAGTLPAPNAVEPDDRVALTFERNEGQFPENVRYSARKGGYAIWFRPSGTTMTLQRSQNAVSAPVTLDWLNANPGVAVDGIDPALTRSNYLIGADRRRWRTNIQHFQRVRYKQLYPGVDVIYYGGPNGLEYDLVIAPGADIGAIAMTISGSRVSVSGDGDLVLHTGAGEIRHHKPMIYQGIGRNRHLVSGGYVIAGSNRISFRVGSYDRTRPLVIDPVVTYSVYFGTGLSPAFAGAIAVDRYGSTYLTGQAGEPIYPDSFPTTPGAFQTNLQHGGRNAFVSKLSVSGTDLIYSTYLGGSYDDSGCGIAVDANGNAYITGMTSSQDFPTTAGSFQPNYIGQPQWTSAAFVAKLSAKGDRLEYATFLGGSGVDNGAAIVVDSGGNAFVTGIARSQVFPVTPGTIQTSRVGTHQAFLTKLNASGSALVYSTLLGGSEGATGNALAVDALGYVYLTGWTNSPDFPTTPGAFQRTLKWADAFVAKVDPTGSTLVYSTLLGGGSSDSGTGIAIDNAGNAYVVGNTLSPDFPATKIIAGDMVSAIFVVKVNSNASGLTYSTILGPGYNWDGIVEVYAGRNQIAVDSAGSAYVAGQTSSFGFPVTPDALMRSSPYGSDTTVRAAGYMSILDPGGSSLRYSSYWRAIGAMAMDSSCNLFLAGLVGSNYPAFYPAVSRIETNSCSSPVGGPLNPTPADAARNVALTPILTWQGGAGLAAVSYDVYFGTTSPPPFADNAKAPSYTPGSLAPGTIYYWRVVAKGVERSTTSAIWTFTTLVPPPGAPVSPMPPDRAIGTAKEVVLNWTGGSGASSYDVYFGGSPAPPLVGSTVATSFRIGTLAPGQTYYWRIVARNGSGSTASPVWSFTTDTSTRRRADFDGDGHTDVIWQDPATGQAQIFFLGGTDGATMLTAANLTSSNTWRIAAVADCNADGTPDIIWQDPTTGRSQIWFMTGIQGNILAGAATLSGANPWRIKAAADFNRDGHPDLIWQDPVTGQAQIWFLGGAQGTVVSGAVNLTASNSWWIVGAADFNRDGQPDVIWQDPVSGATQVWYMAGAQGNTVIGAATLSLRNQWRVAAVGDFNIDGAPDVVWQYPPDGASQIWYLNGTTTVGAATVGGPNPWRIEGPR